LVGQEAPLREELRQAFDGQASEQVSIQPASEVISMGASFSEAWNSLESSVAVAMKLVREGKADAVVSAGNTGATLAAAARVLRRIEGVERPAIMALLPSRRGYVALVDAGANVDCKPRHLVDFAKMGLIYAQHVLGHANPTVGLLNIGSESCKGNEHTREAYKLLEKAGLPFAGNVEGDRVFTGECPVLVCDGFVGNMLLKGCEGLAEYILEELKQRLCEILGNGAMGNLIGDRLLQAMKRFADYAEHGGALLLGVNGVCVVSHGRSDRRAIASAICMAERAVEHDVLSKLRQAL